MEHPHKHLEQDCRWCGKPVLFVAITKADGKPGTVPLDPAAAVYELNESGLQGTRTHNAMVSHFITCPKVREGRAAEKKG